MRLAILGSAVGAAALTTATMAWQASAQSLRVGDRVEASPLMMSSRWESCTVIQLHPAGDVGVACGPSRTEYVVQARWVRPAAGRASASAPVPGTGAAGPSGAAAPQSSAAAAAGCPNAPLGRVGSRQQENGICRIGARVVDRQGRAGTVIDAPDQASCRVCLSDGTHRDYLTWMLSAGSGAPARPAQGGTVPSGSYSCSGGQAGNMRITINGGRWQGYYAERLPDGRVGLSSTPNGRPYYMVCQQG